jgi:transcriptional regulator with XRE-family HTH domain
LSKKDLLKKLEDPEYRQEFLTGEIEIGLPMQIRAMREQRRWKQNFVAEKTGTKQPRFSLMEKPGYGNFSLNTLKKLASLFDVGLIVSFVPWGEMIDFIESISKKRLFITSFEEDRKRLAISYSKGSRASSVASQQMKLAFSTADVSQYRKVEDSIEPIQISNSLLNDSFMASISVVGGGTYASK